MGARRRFLFGELEPSTAVFVGSSPRLRQAPHQALCQHTHRLHCHRSCRHQHPHRSRQSRVRPTSQSIACCSTTVAAMAGRAPHFQSIPRARRPIRLKDQFWRRVHSRTGSKAASGYVWRMDAMRSSQAAGRPTPRLVSSLLMRFVGGNYSNISDVVL
jgi:hypothetical protein